MAAQVAHARVKLGDRSNTTLTSPRVGWRIHPHKQATAADSAATQPCKNAPATCCAVAATCRTAQVFMNV